MKKKTVEQILVGSITKKGKKQISKKIINDSLYYVGKKLDTGVYKILKNAVKQLSLSFEVRTVRRRRNSFSIPLPINLRRRNYLIVKRIMKSLELDKTKRPLKERFIEQIIGLSLQKNKFSAVVEKQLTVKSALKNKANLHYRW